MKQVTCAQMGGPCEAVITGETADEAAKNGYEHIASTQDDAHQGMKTQIDAASEEDKAKWMTGFNETFNNAPDA